jgi:hypothetical protein
LNSLGRTFIIEPRYRNSHGGDRFMDTQQYQDLLEDIRIDMAESQRAITEMRSLETYVQRKLEAKGGNDGHYQELLTDVRRDISGVDKELTELRGVENYLLRKLKGNRGGESFGARPSAAGAAATQPAPPPGAPAEAATSSEDSEDVVEFEPVGSSSKPGGKKPIPLTRPAAMRDRPAPKPLEKPKPRPTPMQEPDANVTVEFGPDGFPMTEPR